MAGMPGALIDRAGEILSQLEEKHLAAPLADKPKKPQPAEYQLTIFDSHTKVFEEIRQLLSGIDINRLTPVEALLKLNEIKEKLK
jgi:DNA mismatch repair protein MutS